MPAAPFSTAPLRLRAMRLRAELAHALLPRLTVGATLPRSRVLAPALGCSNRAAWGHLRAAMADAGVVLEVRRGRLCVTAMPEARADG